MVGAAGFEPATLCPKPDALPGRYTPNAVLIQQIKQNSKVILVTNF